MNVVLLVSRSASSDKRGNFVPFCCFLSLPTVYKYKLRSSSMRDRSFYLTRRSPRCLCLCERANRDGYSERTRRNDHLKKLIRAKTKAAKKKKKKERKKRNGFNDEGYRVDIRAGGFHSCCVSHSKYSTDNFFFRNYHSAYYSPPRTYYSSSILRPDIFGRILINTVLYCRWRLISVRNLSDRLCSYSTSCIEIWPVNNYWNKIYRRDI